MFKIYQTTKEWDKAIQLAETSSANYNNTSDIHPRLSHFHCELAQKELDQDKQSSALKHLQKSVKIDESAVRPWLLLAQHAASHEEYDEANQYLAEVARRDKTYISEAVINMLAIAQKTDSWQQLEVFLNTYWQPCSSSILAKTHLIEKKHGQSQATEFLVEQLRKHPTMKGFKTLMDLYISLEAEQLSTSSLTMMTSLVEKQIAMRPKYRCQNCGFSGRKLYWLCPSCKQWGVVTPIKGLDGE